MASRPPLAARAPPRRPTSLARREPVCPSTPRRIMHVFRPDAGPSPRHDSGYVERNVDCGSFKRADASPGVHAARLRGCDLENGRGGPQPAPFLQSEIALSPTAPPRPRSRDAMHQQGRCRRVTGRRADIAEPTRLTRRRRTHRQDVAIHLRRWCKRSIAHALRFPRSQNGVRYEKMQTAPRAVALS